MSVSARGGWLLLDDRRFVTYPDGQQSADGTIYITYDHERHGAREILFAAFREEDAAAGTPVSGTVRLRQLVSKGSGGEQFSPPVVNANSDGAPLVKTPAGELAGEGGWMINSYSAVELRPKTVPQVPGYDDLVTQRQKNDVCYSYFLYFHAEKVIVPNWNPVHREAGSI